MNLNEMTTTDYVSSGGLVVGMSIIVWNVIRWWRNSPEHDWKEIVFPDVPLLCYGILVILSAGGILGGAGSVALWGSNRIGKVALERGVGAQDVDVTRTNNLVLEEGGHMIVILMTVAFVGWLVFSKESRKNNNGKNKGWIFRIPIRTVVVFKENLNLILPVVAGISLGLSDGVAGWVAQGLGPAVDTTGGLLAGIL